MEEKPAAHWQNNDKELQSNSRKVLLAFTLALVFILTAGVWSLVRYGQRSAVQTAPAPTPLPENASATSAAPNPEYWRPKPFQITLLGPDRTRMELSVAIEHRADPALKKELAKREAQIREIILFAVQRKSKAFLVTSEGRDELRSELLSSINRVMRRPINDIHITELIVR
ncbi:flagellar basal body-associated FliL family protein [Oligoflexus tunisiensis]|uniref:flagellar basal body-associated FliL family protein n=1 Tax=Oligoflexus tunisiensis TaxID=708132 RepID=UPI00159F03D7|nr:flagellar basal body-associated FliL family protein [Oligoflexus tunisiensis]